MLIWTSRSRQAAVALDAFDLRPVAKAAAAIGAVPIPLEEGEAQRAGRSAWDILFVLCTA